MGKENNIIIHESHRVANIILSLCFMGCFFFPYLKHREKITMEQQWYAYNVYIKDKENLECWMIALCKVKKQLLTSSSSYSTKKEKEKKQHFLCDNW